MKKVLIAGSLGQVGSELFERLVKELGKDNVIPADIRKLPGNKICESEHFEVLDVMDYDKYLSIAKKHKVDTIIHLVSLLSATAEKNPQFAWNLNMGGLMNALEIARELKTKFLAPSSVAAYGPDAAPNHTPQDTVMHPTTMYGVTKVAGELLADYYYTKYGVDTRSIRFPGLISYKTEPGGGTSDYNVDMFYQALLKGTYECYLSEDTYMDMMYMDDAIEAVVTLLNADPKKLIHRNGFNITAMSLCPKDLFNLIKKHIPNFTITYKVDPVKQAIADSWPNNFDDTPARQEWGFKEKFDAEKMTTEMLARLTEKFKKEGKLK